MATSKIGFVYIFRVTGQHVYKIGRSIDWQKRARDVGQGNPNLDVILVVRVNDMHDAEKRLHKLYARHFLASPYSVEFYYITQGINITTVINDLHGLYPTIAYDREKQGKWIPSFKKLNSTQAHANYLDKKRVDKIARDKEWDKKKGW